MHFPASPSRQPRPFPPGRVALLRALACSLGLHAAVLAWFSAPVTGPGNGRWTHTTGYHPVRATLRAGFPADGVDAPETALPDGSRHPQTGAITTATSAGFWVVAPSAPPAASGPALPSDRPRARGGDDCRVAGYRFCSS